MRYEQGTIIFESMAELPSGAYGKYQELYYRKEIETGRSQIQAFKKVCDKNYGQDLKVEDLQFD